LPPRTLIDALLRRGHRQCAQSGGFRAGGQEGQGGRGVLLSFDNVIESDDNIVVNVDQVDLGRLARNGLLKKVTPTGGKLLEVRAPRGTRSIAIATTGFTSPEKSG